MTRVLHLLQTDVDHQTATSAGQLAAHTSGTFDVVTRRIGRRGSHPGCLRGFLRLRAEDLSKFDLVHAWGPTALALGILATDKPIVYSPTRFPARSDARWLRAAAASREMHVIAASDTARRAMVTRGVPIERCHLIRPGVDFARIKRRRDEGLRRRLGFAPDDYVLLACGESTHASAHQLAVWASSIIHLLDPRYRLLLWGAGDHVAQAHRLAARTRQHGLIEIATQRLGRAVAFEELFPASDAVLVTATEPIPTLPIAMSMAAALPIVAVVTPTVAELLEDRHTALMVGEPRPRLVARRILDLREDPGIQWTISDMARTEAYEYFSLTRFLNQHRAVYGQIARGERVEVPQPSPGAGLRFHGRA